MAAHGKNWYEAQQVCQYLGEDGLTPRPYPSTFGDCRRWMKPCVLWLATARTVVGYGMRNAKATYKTTPDKESPLWNIHSQVIYWWTATEVDEEHAYIIVYDGKVWPRTKHFGPAYLGFRCVKQPSASWPSTTFAKYRKTLAKTQRAFSSNFFAPLRLDSFAVFALEIGISQWELASSVYAKVYSKIRQDLIRCITAQCGPR